MKFLLAIAALLGLALSIRADTTAFGLSDDFWKEMMVAARAGRGGGGNVVRGNGNVVTGNKNNVVGNSNDLDGNSNDLKGNRNIHRGDLSAIEGDDNWTEGNGLRVQKNGDRIIGAQLKGFFARRPAQTAN